MKGHREKIREMDSLAWMFNQYTMYAVHVAVEHNLAGRKAKSKYIKKPFLEDGFAEEGELSEEELQRQRELFVAKLQAMKTNFDLNKKRNQDSAVKSDLDIFLKKG